MILYHGTHLETLTIQDGMDLCLTDDRDVAAEYAAAAGGKAIFALSLDRAARIADEDDVWAIAESLRFGGGDGDEYLLEEFRRQYVYELVDDEDVREALCERGFAGVRYDDLSPNNATTHETVRVWRACVHVQGQQ